MQAAQRQLLPEAEYLALKSRIERWHEYRSGAPYAGNDLAKGGGCALG